MTVLRCHANSNEHDRQIEPFCSSYMIGLPSFLLGYTFVFYVPSENATLIPVIVSAMRWSWTSYVIFIYILSIYITYIYIYFNIVTWCGLQCYLIDIRRDVVRSARFYILFCGVLERSYRLAYLNAIFENGSRRRSCEDPSYRDKFARIDLADPPTVAREYIRTSTGTFFYILYALREIF